MIKHTTSTKGITSRKLSQNLLSQEYPRMWILWVLCALFRLLLFDASCSNRSQLHLAPWSSRTSTLTQLVLAAEFEHSVQRTSSSNWTSNSSNGLRSSPRSLSDRSTQSFKKADCATTMGNLCSSAHFLLARICGELGQQNLSYIIQGSFMQWYCWSHQALYFYIWLSLSLSLVWPLRCRHPSDQWCRICTCLLWSWHNAIQCDSILYFYTSLIFVSQQRCKSFFPSSCSRKNIVSVVSRV